MTAPLIRLRGVTKTYGSGNTAFQALRGVDMDVQAGEFVGVETVLGRQFERAVELQPEANPFRKLVENRAVYLLRLLAVDETPQFALPLRLDNKRKLLGHGQRRAVFPHFVNDQHFRPQGRRIKRLGGVGGRHGPKRH